MRRNLLCAVMLVLSLFLLATSAQAWAPYVGASEADNEFYRITPAQMAVITAKKGMATSRSFGQNMFGGLATMAGRNPMYKFYYTMGLINLLNYPTTPLTSLPSGFFAPASTYAPNNRILHYYAQITPLTNRIDHFEYFLSTAPYNYANDVEWAFIEFHPDGGMGDWAFFNSYKAKLAAMSAAHPNLQVIRVTAGLWPPGGGGGNEAAWTFSDRVMDPANGLYGNVPIYDWRSILSTHQDGTSAGHYMCPEFNTGDLTHPNQPFPTERLGRALILMLYKIYCDPPLTANAGFDRTWYDTDDNDVETVLLDASASYDPHHNIASYTWSEGGTVLGTGVTLPVSLGLGTHTITLTITNDASPVDTSADPVVVKVAKPKLVVANAGADQTVINCNPPHTISETVGVDGGSSTATGSRTIVSYVWRDAGRTLATGRTASLYLENGVHPLTLTVTDSEGNVDVDALTFTIVEPAARTSEGVQAFYAFKEGSGTAVNDTSAASTAPLNMTIGTPASVSWVAGGGLNVTAPVLIATPGPATRLYDACLPLGDFTLEAWIKPAATVQNGPATIMTMATDLTTRNFTLGQGLTAPDSAACYNVRFRGTGTSSNGEPALLSPAGSTATTTQHVVYVRKGDGGDTLYINGAEVASGIHEGLLDVWSSTNRLALANEIVGGRPWLGTYYMAAIYNRALSYDEISRNFTVGVAPPTPVAPRFLGWQGVVQRGSFDQELTPLCNSATATYTEVRQGALRTIQAVLAKPVNPNTVSKASVNVTSTRNGNLNSRVQSVTLDATRRVITVQMSSLPSADKITLQLLTTVKDAWNQSVVTYYLPQPPVSLTVTVGALVGDVSGNGVVDLNDAVAVRDRIGRTADLTNAQYDLDCSGEIDHADLRLVRRNLGNTLP